MIDRANQQITVPPILKTLEANKTKLFEWKHTTNATLPRPILIDFNLSSGIYLMLNLRHKRFFHSLCLYLIVENNKSVDFILALTFKKDRKNISRMFSLTLDPHC